MGLGMPGTPTDYVRCVSDYIRSLGINVGDSINVLDKLRKKNIDSAMDYMEVKTFRLNNKKVTLKELLDDYIKNRVKTDIKIDKNVDFTPLIDLKLGKRVYYQPSCYGCFERISLVKKYLLC